MARADQSPSLGPVCWASTLEVIVDDQRITSTWVSRARRSPNPSASRAASRMSTKAIVTSCGVVSTFRASTVSSPLTSPSVIVPSVSMSMSMLNMARRFPSSSKGRTARGEAGSLLQICSTYVLRNSNTL